MAAAFNNLAEPTLDARLFGARRISMLTDDALFETLGVRVAFTGRAGGMSKGPYAALNLGTHVDDVLDDVMENRRQVMRALGGQGVALLVPNQVHGSHVETVRTSVPPDLIEAQQRMACGADAVVVTCADVAALLCFADCVPVVLVAPTGAFSVVHAGWRGVVADVVVNALHEMAKAEGFSSEPAFARFASACNVYIGPHIRSECFEVGVDVAETFRSRFGDGCLVGDRQVSMADALRISLTASGIDPRRICDAGICTRCHPDEYYSYRATDGKCGRHGAVAFRKV